jgi:RNA polymerase sigma factor (sigma-70 family)
MIGISNEDLIAQIKEGNERALTRVYDKCKVKALGFLRTNGATSDKAEDIFQEAIIVFYQKAREGKFELTSSIQTYVNSICRNMFLKYIRSKKELVYDKDFIFDENINDDFDIYDDEKEVRISKIEAGLLKMKKEGGRCFEILHAFFYENKSMNDITIQFNYTNAVNTRNQKARCQARLKKMVHG